MHTVCKVRTPPFMHRPKHAACPTVHCTFKMIVGVLTTYHTQYTWVSIIYIFLFNRTTLQVVQYLTGAIYVHPLWFYRHQHHHHHHHHHHKHQGLGHLARSVSRVTAALTSVSLVSQLFSFLVDCSGMILKGFGVVAFFAGVRDSSFCIHLFCPVCIQSVVRGVWSRWSYGH
jgi:hypothetical protein